MENMEELQNQNVTLLALKMETKYVEDRQEAIFIQVSNIHHLRKGKLYNNQH